MNVESGIAAFEATASVRDARYVCIPEVADCFAGSSSAEFVKIY
jgi:hypothetical protein